MSILEPFRQLQLAVNRGVTSISDPEIEWLMTLARTHGVMRSIETGIGNGHSAAALLLAGVEEHVSVENASKNLDIAQTNIMKARKPGQRFRLLFGPSDIRLAALVDAGEKFDLILIDGSHTFEDVFIDIHYSRFLLDDGGVMVLDDMNFPTVRSAARWHERFLSHSWSSLPHPSHLEGPGFNMAAYKRTGQYGRPRPPDRTTP
jgi:predicted O-methyltransferase YrrM